MNLCSDSAIRQKLLIRHVRIPVSKHLFSRKSLPSARKLHAPITRSTCELNHSALDSRRFSQLIKVYVERGLMRKTKLALKSVAIGCGSIIALLILIGILGAITEHGNAQQATTMPTATSAASLAASTSLPTATLPPTALATTVPSPTPTAQPTRQITPLPTHQATPKPTPKPTQPPVCQGAVNNNPWCYSFSGSALIYTPPSGFCNYFNCIATFYAPDDPGDGYIVQCVDGMFSQSGGERGACSGHNGVSRPLYNH